MSEAVRTEPFDPTFILRLSKDERLAQDRPQGERNTPDEMINYTARPEACLPRSAPQVMGQIRTF